MKPRFSGRTQTALVRSFRFLNAGGRGESSSDRIPRLDIRTLSRIHDLNPAIYVCAVALLDVSGDASPEEIRDSPQFRNLIDRLGLQPSTSSKDIRKSHRASLILLEVFTYMVIIHRARTAEEAVTAANRADGQLYTAEELL